jgi:hypothetical protein
MDAAGADWSMPVRLLSGQQVLHGPLFHLGIEPDERQFATGRGTIQWTTCLVPQALAWK